MTIQKPDQNAQMTFFLFLYLPSPGLLPVLEPCEQYMTPTLDAALLISSRVGTDPGLLSGSIINQLRTTANF